MTGFYLFSYTPRSLHRFIAFKLILKDKTFFSGNRGNEVGIRNLREWVNYKNLYCILGFK